MKAVVIVKIKDVNGFCYGVVSAENITDAKLMALKLIKEGSRKIPLAVGEIQECKYIDSGWQPELGDSTAILKSGIKSIKDRINKLHS